MPTDKELRDIIDALDRYTGNLFERDRDFIIDIVENDIRYFSPKQAKWVLDMERRYLWADSMHEWYRLHAMYDRGMP